MGCGGEEGGGKRRAVRCRGANLRYFRIIHVNVT